MRQFVSIVLLVVLTHVAMLAVGAPSQARSIGTVSLSDLPREARDTVALIRKGGPFPYEKDGSVFGNFERRLPLHERGYYREYTVPTPRSRNRGTRRIILGKAGELYYTDDHYESFRQIRVRE
jgi:ribonuclease T1